MRNAKTLVASLSLLAVLAVAAAWLSGGSFPSTAEDADAASDSPVGVICGNFSNLRINGVAAPGLSGIVLARIDDTGGGTVSLTPSAYTNSLIGPAFPSCKVAPAPVPAGTKFVVNPPRPSVTGTYTPGTKTIALDTCQFGTGFGGLTPPGWSRTLASFAIDTTTQTTAEFELRIPTTSGACVDIPNVPTGNPNATQVFEIDSTVNWLDSLEQDGSIAAFNSDWDGDGCLDWEELDPDPTNPDWGDPLNPNDCGVDYTGVYNVQVTALPMTKNVNGDGTYNIVGGQLFHCINRIDHDTGTDAIDSSLICYTDAPGTAGGAYQAYLNRQDGIAGAPPPPPYGFGELNTLTGSYNPGVDPTITIDGCFDNVGGSIGPAVYVDAVVDAETLEGDVDIYLGQDSANCQAGTPNGAPLEATLQLAPQPAGFDHDGDGCDDESELDPAGFPTRTGRDPYNPFDCDAVYNNNITNILATVTPQDRCKTQLPAPACTGEPDGTVVPGAYYHCIGDNQPNPGPGTIRTRIYCYIDIPNVTVNSHSAGNNTTCPPAAADQCGDGLSGIAPPQPFGEVHATHAELTGTITGTTINSEGCFPNVHGALGPNTYVRSVIDGATGLGTADIWTNRPDCNNPDPAPPTSDDVPVQTSEQGKNIDSDGDNCTDKQELGNVGASGGLRDPYNIGDFMSVHTGPAANLAKDKVVSVADISATVARFGANDSGGTTKINRNTNPKTRPFGTGYHPSYDRGGPIPNGGVAGSISRQTPATTGSGAGSVTVSDISAVVAQFGASCV
jgi:hypothetical protein